MALAPGESWQYFQLPLAMRLSNSFWAASFHLAASGLVRALFKDYGSEAETACAASEGPWSVSPKVYSSAGLESDSAWTAEEGCLIFYHSSGGVPRLLLVKCLVGCDNEGAGEGENGPEDGEGDSELSRGGIEYVETNAWSITFLCSSAWARCPCCLVSKFDTDHWGPRLSVCSV